MRFLINTFALLMCIFSTSNWATTPVKSDLNRYIAFNWGTCPELFQSRDGQNLCTLAQVPLDWDAPSGQQIEVLVSKHPASSGNSKGQIWLLQGGPGGSGSFFVNQFDSTLATWLECFGH